MGLFLSQEEQVIQEEVIQNVLDTLDQLERQLEANKANAAFQKKLVQLMLDEKLKPKRLTNSDASLVSRTEIASERNNLEGAVACSEHSEDPFDMILMEMLEHSKDGNMNETEYMLITFKKLQKQFEKYVPKRLMPRAKLKDISERTASLERNDRKKAEECRLNNIAVKALTIKGKSYKTKLSQMEDKDTHKTQEINNLQKQIKELKEIIQQEQRLIENEQTDKTKLANEYDKKMLLLQNEIKDHHKEIEDLNKKHRDQIQNQQYKIQELQIKHSIVFGDHNKERLRYQNEIKLLQTENSNEKQMKHDKIKQLTNLNQESLLKQQETIKALKKENGRFVEKQTDEIKKLYSLMQIEKQSLVNEHTAEKQSQQDKIEDLRNEIKSLTKWYAEIENHKDENNKLKDRNTLMEVQEKQLRQDIAKLKREVLQQSEELKIYKRQIRVPAALQIYCRPRGNMTTPLLDGIKHLFTEKFGDLRMDLPLKICEDVKDVVDYKPALVLCVNASGLGTDVSRALEGLKATSLKSIVVIHPKEQQALPRQASKDVLSSPLYRSLGGIYDMAFLSERGYYACDMNNKAVNNIAEFIKNIYI